MLKQEPYSHEKYKKKTNKRLNKYVNNIPEHHALALDLLFLLDLSLLYPIVSHLYASFGAIAWQPELMFRSLIAMMLCGVTSFDVWVSMMRSTPFYAIICGFHPTKVPGVGTFYDFCDRLLGLDNSPPKHIRRPFRKRSQKDKSANKDKNADTKKHDGIIQKLAERIIRRPIEETKINPFALESDFSRFKRYRRVLLQIFYLIFVDNSIRLGLIDLDNLFLSGDGSKISTYASSHGKKLCDCDNRGQTPKDKCDCQRRYNDYEARWGYDSYRDCWVYGYSIYELTSYSLTHPYSLPMVLDIIPANRHDSVNCVFSLYEACNLLGLDVNVSSFDAASDAKGIYQLGVQYWECAMVIPLNPRNTGNTVNLPAKEFTENGRPICSAGRPMAPSWYDKSRQRFRWKCPLVALKSTPDVDTCPYASECSPSSYGRVIYTYPKENYRRFTTIIRDSDTWKKHYNRHANCENTHKRKKEDYAIKYTKTAGRERWFLRAILAAMCQHLSAWYKWLHKEKEAA